MATVRWRGHFVPWIKNDIHGRMKTMSEDEWNSWDAASNAPGMQARWDGSVYYPTKVPDLIGIKDRKYFDSTATHRHRGIEDLMRYAAQVDSADSPNFGEYDILPRHDRRVPYRRPDEAWYALSLYIYSLKPPPNPNKFDATATAGQKLFTPNCAGCHAPPLYTNNKLTLAKGFQPSEADRKNPDVMLISVGTDPGGALLTRKGTGYYKVPSLKGVSGTGGLFCTTARWHRSRRCSIPRASSRISFAPKELEPARRVTKRAVPGHEIWAEPSVLSNGAS